MMRLIVLVPLLAACSAPPPIDGGWCRRPLVFASDLDGSWTYTTEVERADEALGLSAGATSEPAQGGWVEDADYLYLLSEGEILAIFSIEGWLEVQSDARCGIEIDPAAPLRERSALRIDWSQELFARAARDWTAAERVEPLFWFDGEDPSDFSSPIELQRDENGVLREIDVRTMYYLDDRDGARLVLRHHFERTD